MKSSTPSVSSYLRSWDGRGRNCGEDDLPVRVWAIWQPLVRTVDRSCTTPAGVHSKRGNITLYSGELLLVRQRSGTGRGERRPRDIAIADIRDASERLAVRTSSCRYCPNIARWSSTRLTKNRLVSKNRSTQLSRQLRSLREKLVETEPVTHLRQVRRRM